VERLFRVVAILSSFRLLLRHGADCLGMAMEPGDELQLWYALAMRNLKNKDLIKFAV
jgi:hypothetical protein